MDGLGGYYASEKSDREDKCCVFTYTCNLQNKQNQNRLTDTENKSGYQSRGDGECTKQEKKRGYKLAAIN